MLFQSPSMSGINLLLALVLFLLRVMNCCGIESLAYIACILQQLLQTPLAVLIEIYFEVMRTSLALVATILFTLLRASRFSCSGRFLVI